MDERLIPINGLIALLRGDGGWPSMLGEQGLRRHQLELPLNTPRGDIRADALIYRRDPDLILLCEAKSGGNLDEEQARRYLSADLEWLRRRGVIPPELNVVDSVAVQTLFVGQERHRARLETGLRHLDVNAPLLTIGPDRVRLSGAAGVPGLDDFDERHDGGLPPARLPVDHQSPDEELLELLIQQIVAIQARNEDIVAVESMADMILPEWAILAHGTRQTFIGRIDTLLRAVAAGEMRGQLRYEGLPGPHPRGRIVIEKTPATRDPRGRTQAWQAQQRRASAALRRRQAVEKAGQLSLDALANEGGLAEE